MGSPLAITLDACGATTPPGILNTFAVGPHARTLAHLDPAGRRQAVVAEMATRFGPKAAKVRDFVEQEWAGEEWTRGCFMSPLRARVMTQFGHLVREPVGRVHWAGTETSAVMNGFIDGAVRSGERAADEVVAAEGRPRAVMTA
jgi:monoamine oxidase